MAVSSIFFCSEKMVFEELMVEIRPNTQILTIDVHTLEDDSTKDYRAYRFKYLDYSFKRYKHKDQEII